MLRARTVRELRSAWRRVLHLWRPMAGWTLLVWAVVASVLVPLSSALLSRQLLRGPRAVVGNEELVAWLLSPLGFLYLLFAGGLALTAAVVRYAGLFHIVTDDMEGRPPSVRRTALDLAPHLPRLFKLCVITVVGALILAVPLLLGLGGVYLVFLAEHDINYYLYLRPAEWTHALVAGGVWAALWAAGAAYLAARLILGLPSYLDGHRPFWTAARRSWELTRGRAARLLRLLALAVALWLGVRALLNGVFFGASSLAVGWMADLTTALRPLVLATAGYTAGSFVLDAVLAFLGFSFVATVLTKFYLEDTELHAEAPPGPRLADLPGAARALLEPNLHPVRLLPGLVLLVLLAGAGSQLLLDRIPEPEPVAIHAHRGGPPPHPENTLSAIEASIAAGADYAEIDVQRTLDGRVVLLHDADFMRVAGDPRRVADVDYGDIAHLVQRPDDGSPPEERRVATLDEVLERARGRIGLNIELKYYGPDPGLADEVVRLVRAHGMEDEVVLMSLSLEAIRRIRALAPEIPVGFVAAVAVGDLSRLPVDFLAVHRPLATSAFVGAAHERGIRVYPWTVNRAGAVAELIQRGVDGIITDDPALVARVNREIAELSTVERLLVGFRGLPETVPGVEREVERQTEPAGNR